MIITSDQLPDVWQVVQSERASSSEKGVIVLHSISEVDSACATRLLMVRGGGGGGAPHLAGVRGARHRRLAAGASRPGRPAAAGAARAPAAATLLPQPTAAAPPTPAPAPAPTAAVPGPDVRALQLLPHQ
jgi:hypothetical protein